MCYLSQVKHCKTNAMLYLNYVKQNTTSVLVFQRMLSKTQITQCIIEIIEHTKQLTHFCFN